MIGKTMLRYMENNLVWLPEMGLGYYPVKNSKYGKAYFMKYKRYENTPIGKCLNNFRTKLVKKYTRELILDVGIGCGTFIKFRGACLGYDINPWAVKFLESAGLFFDPYIEDLNERGVKGVTFFDSLEHLQDPGRILERISTQFVFVSIPIFSGLDHLLRSKHFKRNEHFYYFTRQSFINFMKDLNFRLLEERADEIACGREGIHTFVFRKEEENDRLA